MSTIKQMYSKRDADNRKIKWFLLGVALVLFPTVVYFANQSRTSAKKPDAVGALLPSAQEAADIAETRRAEERAKSFEAIMDDIIFDINNCSKLGLRRTMSVVQFADPEVIKLVIQNLKAKGYTVYTEKDAEVPDVLYLEW